ncbi:vacuolar iron transporter-like protein 4-like [Senna tora]|uniref:Vacuolar iron transporter-like protein 4-like n=1 Tax=Senna tora TaxID=362788 RepID=A0A834SZG2_9FABA|nr:vacuolar iron transporter-like protein 4-like [Senna tora]
MASTNHQLPKFAPQTTDLETQTIAPPEIAEGDSPDFDYSKRSQWLRAAVLGANDGLVSTASLMMGVGAVKQDIKAMILTGFAGLVAGACSMAIGEFVSVYSQLDIELAQIKRDNRMKRPKAPNSPSSPARIEDKEDLPNPLQAAAASALAFSVGAMVPLLGASFIKEYKVRVGVVVGAVTLALVVFGWLGAVLGRAPAFRSMGSLKVQHERLYEVHPIASLCQAIIILWNKSSPCIGRKCCGLTILSATTWMHEICNVKKDVVSVSRLRNCGVIFIGKANLHGLGMGTTGNNPNYIMASKHTTSVILMLDKVKKYK